jgi:hypothetical protein
VWIGVSLQSLITAKMITKFDSKVFDTFFTPFLRVFLLNLENEIDRGCSKTKKRDKLALCASFLV